MFRLGLIGSTGHWLEYPRMLNEVDGAQIVAVASAPDEDGVDRFEAAPGVTPATKRYDAYSDLLESGSVDAVQVCVRPGPAAEVVADCMRAGIPVMADKPLAADQDQLVELWSLHRETGVTVVPTHMYRRTPSFALIGDLVRRGQLGEIASGQCTVSFRWGSSRPDWFRSRTTFPGTFAFIGVHAVDTLYWVLGDCFESAVGSQAIFPHPDYPGCASATSVFLRLRSGGAVTIAVNFLRPPGARSHGDLRLNLAGSRGVVDTNSNNENRVALVAERDTVVDAADVPFWYTTFARHVVSNARPFITTTEAFRITEIALRIQHALDTEKSVDLRPSAIV